MNLITLDFETYYDRQYSLKKVTTEEYIRSPHFEVIGLGIKLNGREVHTNKLRSTYLPFPGDLVFSMLTTLCLMEQFLIGYLI